MSRAMRALKAIVVAALFCALGQNAAWAQSISASPATVYAGWQSVTGTWSAIAAPTSTDWVALYPVGAADNAFIAWTYTDGTAAGSVPLAVPSSAAPGSYELRLFSNNVYTLLATSNSFSVQSAPPASLSESPAAVTVGQVASATVTATWSSIFQPTSTDWIALYPVGAANNAFVAWRYTDGTAAGSVPFTVPANAAAGSYELRLFSNNVYTYLATSSSFTVQNPPAATLSESPSNVPPGQSVSASWTNIFAPSATDWIALYPVGAADNAFISWRYADGTAAGSVPFAIPANVATGTYELRLFANNGYTKLATSASFTVGAAASPAIYFIEVDHLNTPRLIADANQNTVWKWDNQEPFGNDVPGTFDFPLRFPGQYFDQETNVAYNHFRDYDPALGRYVESDPIGLSGGLNTYGYASSAPLASSDPSGKNAGIGVLGGIAIGTAAFCRVNPQVCIRVATAFVGIVWGNFGGGSESKRERCIRICNTAYNEGVAQCTHDYDNSDKGFQATAVYDSCLRAHAAILKACLASCPCD